MSGDIVKLDIGGYVFKTSRSTLTRFDGFFKTLLETETQATKDEFFIDRDPKHFRLILGYMRDGNVTLPASEKEIWEIREEAFAYKLEGLVKLCNDTLISRVSGSIVKLNIGGTVFQTSKSTLTKIDFFSNKLATQIPVARDESGVIFIDRDPKHFRLILNFMRDGDVEIPNSDEDRRELFKEAKYYQLHDLMEKCFDAKYRS